MVYGGPPAVVNDGIRGFTRERVPPWCGLPVPGTWALRISNSCNNVTKTQKIDTKRMYTISSSPGADIQIPELENEELKIHLYHHRSDGQVYVSVRGGSELVELDGTVLGSEPVVFDGELRIGNDVTIEIIKQGRMNPLSVREALRSCQTEDEATRRNTALNGGKRRGTPIRGGGTPLSGYRPRKRCQKEDCDVENKSSVRFIDFSNI